MSRLALLTTSTILALAADPVLADVTITENFATNPLTAGRAHLAGPDGTTPSSRFDLSTPGHVVASYNTASPTAELVFPLNFTLTNNHRFSFQTTFTLTTLNAPDTTDLVTAGQLAFGLINQSKTGFDRAGGLNGGDANNALTFDYFPMATGWSAQGLGPSVIGPANSTYGYYNTLYSPKGKEFDLSEGPLPTQTRLTANVSWEPVTRTATLTIKNADIDQLLPIDTDGDTGPGGPDGNIYTIQNQTDVTALKALDWNNPTDTTYTFEGFQVDAFALTLWQDTYLPASWEQAIDGTVTFDSFAVTYNPTAVPTPEPASLAFLALGSLVLLRRR